MRAPVRHLWRDLAVFFTTVVLVALLLLIADLIIIKVVNALVGNLSSTT